MTELVETCKRQKLQMYTKIMEHTSRTIREDFMPVIWCSQQSLVSIHAILQLKELFDIFSSQFITWPLRSFKRNFIEKPCSIMVRRSRQRSMHYGCRYDIIKCL